MLHYFNISMFSRIIFHLAFPTQCLSSCSSVHWSFRKFPFKSLRKKKNSVNGLDLASSCWKHAKFQFIAASNLCGGHLEREIFVSRMGDKQYLVSVSLVSETNHRLHYMFGNTVPFFSYLCSRIVFTFEVLGEKVSNRQIILKAFEFMFFLCRSLDQVFLYLSAKFGFTLGRLI